ncbi:hypothetical protein [uncultured Alsobacter sp.]|uniref:hypothetical protein n=1 Tax=uncultured Alsobacter sp. TaxID=1748258 RepID=UPI0025D06438|nr:hypothetical protein [uncultured Alsobacter sp.]
MTLSMARRQPAVVREQGWDALAAAYPGWSETDLRQLLAESSWIYDFEAFTQLRIRAKTGRFVNIDAAGFRHVASQAPWPPRRDALNVFLYGGSNLLGSGLPDAQTIPSVLQDMLRRTRPDVAVYNFGRSYYYSSQERALFERHILKGVGPHVAVFLDGLNEFVYPDDEPQWTGALRNMISTRHLTMVDPLRGMGEMVGWFVRTARRRLLAPPPRPSDPAPAARGDAETVVDRWLLNRRLTEALGEEVGITTLFAWQPVPTFGYDLSLHGFVKAADGFGPFNSSAAGYALMARLRDEGRVDPRVLWLADMQDRATGNLYVDNVHYNAAFSAAVAGRIADTLRECGLVIRP